MKKISRRSFLTAMAAVSAAGVLTACGASSSTASSVASSVAASSEATTSSEAVPESVTIKAFNGAKELVDVEVPFDPQRIAILELASLDILDELGVGDRVVGTASTSLDYLQSYVTNDSIVNLGNIKEADMEAVMACEPDIIFIGGRLSKSYDALCEIAPVVFLATDAEKGVVESTRENAMTIASIFGLEDHVEALMADFDSRIDALKAFAEGKTAIVGMTTSGSFNVLGNDGRCSIIGREVGFTNLGVDLRTSAWMPISTPRPTATRLPSSSLWTRTPTTSSPWTAMQPLAPMARRWHRKSWKTSWSRARMLTRTATSFIWHTRMSGTPQRAAFRH